MILGRGFKRRAVTQDRSAALELAAVWNRHETGKHLPLTDAWALDDDVQRSAAPTGNGGRCVVYFPLRGQAQAI